MQYQRSTKLITVGLALLIASHSIGTFAQPQPKVKLVLQLTIDGLRGDLLNRYRERFTQGGFRYLLEKGTVYTNAHYQHANTETIVGHTTLATGAFPSEHGMIGNVWFDRETGELAYNIEDPDHPLIPTRKTETKGEQVDPAQKLSRTQGRSPVSILAATLGDGLKAYSGGKSKIFGVSGKDRSAVSMVGKTGKAFWYSTNTGDFISSTYYYDAYPAWVLNWNAQRKGERTAGSSWNLLNNPETYSLKHQDDRAYEADLKGYGRVFPHPFGKKGDKLLFTRLLASPVGDQLTLDFSKLLISSEQLGQDAIPDYLSISFSSVDAVNHFFGPSSLENEDVILQLDRTLADLIAFVDKEVGLKNTLIILSADHGMADMPEYMTELGYAAGRLHPEDVIKVANDAGKQIYQIDEVVRFFFRPYLYLDHNKIALAKKDPLAVERTIATALAEHKGIALAVPKSSLSLLNVTPAVRRIQRNFHAARAGDIYVAQNPYWFMFNKGAVAAMHGSPWRYDTHVPIIFAGSTISPKVVHRLVHPVDVAPTIAAILGMSPPSSAQGTLLPEVFR